MSTVENARVTREVFDRTVSDIDIERWGKTFTYLELNADQTG